MRLCTLAGTLTGLALAAASSLAGADEVVYTDSGWYQVQGADTSPGAPPGELIVMPAPPAPPAPAPAAAPAPAPVPMPAPPPAWLAGGGWHGRRAPSCLSERGALLRRLLTLRGYEVSDQDVSDAELGRLAGAGPAASGLREPWVPEVSWDPDAALVSGAVPLPPGALAYDWEVRELSEDLLRCQAR